MAEERLVEPVVRRLKLRSKNGCIACKLAKHKCDEVRPVCGPCRRRGQCEWLSGLSPDGIQAYERRRNQRRKFELILKEKPGTVPPPWLGSDQQGLRISLLLHSLFRGADAPCSGAGNSSLSVHTELYFASEGSLTRSCLDAMSMVHWGHMKKDSTTLRAGLAARGMSLMRMRCALTDAPRSSAGDVVAAVALTRVFETMLPGAKDSWVLHAQGLARLFAMMGPGSFQSPEMLRLVENNRWPIITSSSALRRPSMFDSDSWRTVPWQRTEKDMLQQLLDTYSRVPSIHALWDETLHSSEKEDLLVVKLQQTLSEMHAWRNSVDSEITASAKLWRPAETIEPCAWQAAISFEELIHGYGIALFNMMIIVLSQYISRHPGAGDIVRGPVHSSQEHALLRGSLLPLGSARARAAQAADEIASMIPWALRQRTAGAGAFYMAGKDRSEGLRISSADEEGPIHIADQFWRLHDPKKAQWSGTVIHHISSSWSNVLLSNVDFVRR